MRQQPTISNLGAVLSVLAMAEVNEEIMHADVSAWGAPSECHADVSRGEDVRMAEAVAQAEAMAGAPLETILADARERGGVRALTQAPEWQDVLGRLYHRYCPFT